MNDDLQNNDCCGRRQFLKTAVAASVSLGLPATLPAPASETAGKAAPARPEVAAIYFPSWHRYSYMDSRHGSGWTEWELVKSAPPRFAGHHQPKRPSWGYFDESDPKWSQQEIDLAADHGIDAFLFDWYWYSGVRLMEEGLERGFLKAPNRNRMKFALMWANHNWGEYFPWPYDKPFQTWLPVRHSPADLTQVIDYCTEHYFREPNYWTVGGRLFFSIFQPYNFIDQLGSPEKTKELLAGIDAWLDRRGLPPIHWNAMVDGPGQVARCRDAGFRSTTIYNVTDSGKTSPQLTQDYEDLMQAHHRVWKAIAATPLSHIPVVTMGWDVTPRCEHNVPFPFAKHNYPYCRIVVGNTPERFGKLCKAAADFAAQDPNHPPAILVNAWNEWTEGSYLLPERKCGTAYLAELRRAFSQ